MFKEDITTTKDGTEDFNVFETMYHDDFFDPTKQFLVNNKLTFICEV